jgi:ABC-2 type transport system permease protein
VVALAIAGVASAILGGAFGVLVMSNLRSQRSANQVFPFLLLPQFFLGGAFAPIRHLPLPLDILSHLAPMRYAIDLTRDLFYAGRPDGPAVVLESPLFNVAVIAAMIAVFLVVGTARFVSGERNR